MINYVRRQQSSLTSVARTLLLTEAQDERLPVLPVKFALIDKPGREHRPPGPSQVVVGVQHVSRGEHREPGRHLIIVLTSLFIV